VSSSSETSIFVGKNKVFSNFSEPLFQLREGYQFEIKIFPQAPNAFLQETQLFYKALSDSQIRAQVSQIEAGFFPSLKNLLV
jgi:FKBP-type peptidyl-prolyl cis-trans isomerase 2